MQLKIPPFNQKQKSLAYIFSPQTKQLLKLFANTCSLKWICGRLSLKKQVYRNKKTSDDTNGFRYLLRLIYLPRFKLGRGYLLGVNSVNYESSPPELRVMEKV